MADADWFPKDYFDSRERFKERLAALDFAHEAHEITARGPAGEALTIDVGIRAPRPEGPAADRTLVLSSGLHGAEGPFGAAAQAAFLSTPALMGARDAGCGVVLIHALNPFGYAHGRRWNEDNVDLNRNFFVPGGAYSGAPALYGKLNRFLNPETPPKRPDSFPLIAGYWIARFGLPALKQALAGGQYAFPKGLFYGGARPAQTVEILSRHLGRWIGAARRVLHLDFHTGLGAWGAYKLLTETVLEDARIAALRARFGAEHVERATPDGVSYASTGTLKDWAEATFPDRVYDVLTVEFGAYSGPRTLQALRAENRAWHWAERGRTAPWALSAVAEAFVPADPAWRRSVLDDSARIIGQAVA